MNITPIGERVLLKPVEGGELMTKGGLYLPETDKEKRKEATVVACGTKDGKDLPLKAGDKVLYGGYSSDEFEIDGETYVIIEFKDVLAKIN